MTFNELYKKLEEPIFQDTATGALFYNVYICQYNIQEEYEVIKEIKSWKERLFRPVNNLDVLTIDIFEEFCRFLQNKSFGKQKSMFHYLLEKETKDASESRVVQQTLTRNADSEEFVNHIAQVIVKHFTNESDFQKPFIFLYGFSQIFPYLRVNAFLSKFEKHNSGENYKMLVFYPGSANGNTFNLFDVLNDNHTYRSIRLLEEALTCNSSAIK